MSLSGKTIVVTRDVEQAKPFIELLNDYKAITYLFPTIKFTKPDETNEIQRIIENIAEIDWVLFTSTNAVNFFLEYIGKKQSVLNKIKMACVGKKTAEALIDNGFSPLVTPKKFTAIDLLAAMQDYDIEGKRILLPVSNVARDDLEIGLKERGAQVHRLVVYNTVPNNNLDTDLFANKIRENQIDCLTFFSPSAVKTFSDLVGREVLDMIMSKNIPFAVIGPTTAKAARERSFKPIIQPENSEIESFVKTLQEYFST